MTKIIDGRAIAADLLSSIAARIAQLDYQPVLKVIIVGDDPASLIYVKKKTRAASQVGIDSETIHLPSDTTEIRLLVTIYEFLNDFVDAIVVQLPLPANINLNNVVQLLHPDKDVDGFHPLNVGLLMSGQRRNVPCTPKGIMMLLNAARTPLQGANALVVGRSAIVGRPVCTLLSQADATVTLAHSMTRGLTTECRRADIIVSAVGQPNLIRGDMIKPGAVIIDVGINRLPDGRLCGDVAYDECLGIASAITPVPGGVGPMTVACLLENTLEAAIARR